MKQYLEYLLFIRKCIDNCQKILKFKYVLLKNKISEKYLIIYI